MSKTLKLTEHLLHQGRQFAERGRDQDALETFSRLICLGSLPPLVAEEAQLQLANIHLRREDYAQARRHLHVLLVCSEDKPEYHYLMATAYDLDEDGDPDRASHHYERAVKLDPDEGTYWHDFGLCLLQLGAEEEGYQALETSIERSPKQMEFLQNLVRALAEAGEFTRARKATLHAMFRDPDDPRLRRLWDDLRFRETLFNQRAKLHPAATGKAAKPVLLPYRKPRGRGNAAKVVESENGAILRYDNANSARPPHAPRRKKYRDSK